MKNLKKIALITGASSGIGKALAENFAKDGYDVILTARSSAKLAALAAELQQRYAVAATVICADLATAQGAAQLHADIKSRDITLSALANNAGYGVYGLFQDTTLPDELAMMQLNMYSVVVLCKLFMPDLRAQQGKIINVASTAAFQPGPYMAVYYASKSFVLSFSEAIASELEGTGVTVTALCPGLTASGFQDAALMNNSALVKGKKMASADEVAALGYQAMQRGKRVFIPGLLNWLMALGVRFSPRDVVTSQVKAMSKPI